MNKILKSYNPININTQFLLSVVKDAIKDDTYDKVISLIGKYINLDQTLYGLICNNRISEEAKLIDDFANDIYHEDSQVIDIVENDYINICVYVYKKMKVGLLITGNYTIIVWNK